MTRSDKPIGDLEYEKFEDGSDAVPTIRVKQIDGYDFKSNMGDMLLILERIESELKKLNAYQAQFFKGELL